MENKYKVLLSVICFLFMTFLLINIIGTDKKEYLISSIDNKNDIDTSNKNTTDDIINNLNNEYNSNDVIGIIEFPSSNKKEPIVQTTNNDYYLYHTPDKKESDRGSIFLDYRNDIDKSKKLLIYGHSSRVAEFPFNFLQNYHDYEYYQKNKYILIRTENEVKKYEIFSVYVETKDFSYMETNFVDDEDYLFHINSLKNKSLYETGINLSKSDEVLILQTCSTHSDYKKYENKYLLIIARRV